MPRANGKSYKTLPDLHPAAAESASAAAGAVLRDRATLARIRYHRHWREVRDETKYARMIEFAAAPPSW